MPHLPFIDSTQKEFIVALDRMRARAVQFFIRLKDNLTADQLRTAIATGMESFVMNELNFNGDIDKLMLAYDKILLGTPKFAEVSEVTLRALKNVKRAEWVALAKFEIGAIQNEIFNASITGQWEQDVIINNLESGVQSNLSKGQVATLIATSLAVFERGVKTVMMRKMPDNTPIIYIGPQDEKTRDICNEMLGVGELTVDQVIATFGPSVLQVGGGHNCRHSWELVV